MPRQKNRSNIVDPTADLQPEDRTGQLAERPKSLDGKHITLYSNNKQNSDHFLRGVGDALLERYPDATIADDIVYKSRASEPGTRWGLIEKVSPKTDVVLVAYGDCGACSLYTIHDVIQFERRGVPAVAYCSDKFMRLSRYDALNSGVPGLPIVQFEHPIADLTPEQVRDNRITDEVVEDTEKALTTESLAIEEDFASRYSVDDFDGRPSFDICTL